jgi:hypothetical protein
LLTNHPHEYDAIGGFLGGTSKHLARTHVSGNSLIRSQIITGSGATVKLYTIEQVGADDEFGQNVTKHILADITEDFVVGIDIDEFWVMPKGISTFVEMIAADNNHADVHYAAWAMTANDGLDAQAPPYPVWQDKEYKWMARTSAIEEFQPHDPRLKHDGKKKVKRYYQGELLHFWGRTFTDPLLKGMTGNGTQKGGEGPANTIELLNKDLLPQRLKLLAFLVIHPTEKHMSFEAPLMKVEKNLEMQYASVAFNASLEQTQHILSKARQAYVAFKGCLAQQEGLSKVHQAIGHPGGPSFMQIASWLDKIPCNGEMKVA